MHFADRLFSAARRAGNAVLVGIDPRMEDLPEGMVDRFSPDRAGVADAFRAFGHGVVDAVAGAAPAVKFQAAFYEAYGPEGISALHATAQYAHEKGLVVIIDGKRNDIGSTAEAYARAYLGKMPVADRFEATWQADALTVNPYLGSDGITPFIKVAARENKGLFVLVKTSNATSGEVQDLVADGKPIYRHVAGLLARWAKGHEGESGYSLAGAVVGATYPEQLAQLREELPGVVFLVPGYGTQGGSAADVAPAFDENGLGAIVNNSRGLTFAYKRPAFKRFGSDWQAAIGEALREMSDDLAQNTKAGKLRTSEGN